MISVKMMLLHCEWFLWSHVIRKFDFPRCIIHFQLFAEYVIVCICRCQSHRNPCTDGQMCPVGVRPGKLLPIHCFYGEITHTHESFEIIRCCRDPDFRSHSRIFIHNYLPGRKNPCPVSVFQYIAAKPDRLRMKCTAILKIIQDPW